jgi:aminoglycoside phosphotransferase (APT) family kinase protein
MSINRMHRDEREIDKALASRLVVEQYPQWAHLPLEPVLSAGTDNAIYRLGHRMAVRLPRRADAAKQVEKESLWLPRLASHLPLAVPVPLGLGLPVPDYPFHWSVCRWLAGENAVIGAIADLQDAAVTLAQFVGSLHDIDPSDGPPPGPHNFYRGAYLTSRDVQTRSAIENLHGIIDTYALTRVWDAALRIEPWCKPPVWIHGDLHAGNLLVENGRLAAVIDFGGLGVGDPACDLMVGWTLLSSEARSRFRSALAVDAATWARGRAWALSVAIVALPYYLHTNPVLVSISRRAIREVLADLDG